MGRRQFTYEEKLAIVAETKVPGASIGSVMRKHGLAQSVLHKWRNGKALGKPDEPARKPEPPRDGRSDRRTDDEKRALLAEVAARPEGTSLTQMLKRLKIGPASFYSWQHKFGSSGPKKEKVQTDMFAAPVGVDAEAWAQKMGAPGTKARFDDDFKRKAVAAYHARPAGTGARMVANRLGMPGPHAGNTLLTWVNHPKYANAATEGGQLVTNGHHPSELMDAAEVLEANPLAHMATERIQKQLVQAREEIQRLKEDNAILRGIATLAIRRGLLEIELPRG